MQRLRANGILCCGAAKSDRKGIPDVKAQVARMERGEAMQFQHNDMVLTIWKDVKPVSGSDTKAGMLNTNLPCDLCEVDVRL